MGQMQYMDWGYTDWVFEPQPGSRDAIRAGISTMPPGTKQPRHVHSGDEQLIFIIQGSGRQVIGDRELPIEPGKAYHISTGTSHETVNDGQEDLIKLVISVPATLGGKMPSQEMESLAPAYEADADHTLSRILDTVSDRMIGPLKMPLLAFEPDGRLIFSNHMFPAVCHACCAIDEDPANCDLYRQKDVYSAPLYAKPSGFVCKYGMSMYTMPIVCDGVLLGYLKTGHVRTAKPTVDTFPAELPYHVTKSAVIGILKTLDQLAGQIGQHYRMYRMEASLKDSREALSNQEKQEKMLQASLWSSQNKVLNLQMSRHFLFNTLNMIMGLSIRERAEQTYEAVANLAQLLQYTLRNNSYFVSLREEVDYLKNYTNIQQMRFGDRLRIGYRVDPSLLDEIVAFNCLQPIVENCFQHGFFNKEGKLNLDIDIRRDGNCIRIEVKDDGLGMSEEQLCALKHSAETGEGVHGTAMVMWRLHALYAESCRYSVRSSAKGTRVTILLPMKGDKKDEADSIGG